MRFNNVLSIIGLVVGLSLAAAPNFATAVLPDPSCAPGCAEEFSSCLEGGGPRRACIAAYRSCVLACGDHG